MRYIPTRRTVRLYLWIGILVTVMIVPYSLFLSHRFSAYAYTQMDLYHRDKTVQTANRTDFLFNKLKAYALHLYEDRDVRDWLQVREVNPVGDMEALQSLSGFMASEPFVKRVYLVNLQQRAVLDSAQGVVPFSQFDDPALLAEVEQGGPAFLRFYRHELNEEHGLVLLVPAAPSKKKENGYLVVLLDDDALQAHLLETNEQLGTNVWILDGEGRVLLGGIPMNKEGAPVPQASYEAGTIPGTYGEVGENQFVNSTPLTSQEGMVLSLSDMRMFRAQAASFQRGIVWGSLLVLLGLLAAAFWNSRRVIQPYRYLAESLLARFPEEPGGKQTEGQRDEYSAIKTGIERLTSEMEAMSETLEDTYPLAKAEYLREWLLQGRMNQSVRSGAMAAGGLLERETLRIAILKVDRYGLLAETMDVASRRALKETMGRLAKEPLTDCGAAVETIDLAGDHLVLLIGTEAGEAELSSLLTTIKCQITARLGLGVTIAMSEAKHREDDLRAAYDFCLEIARLRFLGGEDRIYTGDDYEACIGYMQPLAETRSLDHLLVSVRAGNPDQIADRLDNLFGPMTAMRYAECRVRLTVILFTIMKEFDNLSALQSVDGIDKQLERFSTLAELREWLEQELLTVVERLGSRKSLDRKEKLVEEMKAYVQARIEDPMLAAEDVADHISLSVKYVRQMFLDMQNVSLAAYMLDLRIGKVKELLLATDLPVADIGERSGFLTRSHFFTAFKKATGMTPSQYRQLHSEPEEERTG